MRFFYILRTEEPKNGGVCKKIKGQIKNLKKQGVIVFLNQYEEIWNSVLPKNQNKIVGILHSKIFILNIFFKMKREFLVNNALNDLIKTSKKDDILYFRFPVPSFMLSKILKKPRKCKIVIEYQSIEPLEWRSKGEWILILTDIFFGGAIRKYSDAIVGVTNEITQYERKRSGCKDKKYITIGNGFDVNSVNIRKPPKFTSEELLILGVADVNRWHGFDRVIAGIALYSGSLCIKLHIAGSGPDVPYLMKMVKDYKIDEKVIFHGFVSNAELDSLFDNCHIAVGSLGMHRIGLKEASILKAREYCSRGIPFILGYLDPDFPAEFVYAYNIPDDETPVSIEDIVHFTGQIFNDLGHSQRMRDYAMNYIDWSVKMKRLKEFLENLI
jgi:glycosyltransferase involved in cell wall biosynthesis